MSSEHVCPYIAHVIGAHCVFAGKRCEGNCLDVPGVWTCAHGDGPEFLKKKFNIWSSERRPLNMDENKRKLWVKYVRDMGEHLIKNAESIVGDEDNLDRIRIDLLMEDGYETAINVNKRYEFGNHKLGIQHDCVYLDSQK